MPLRGETARRIAVAAAALAAAAAAGALGAPAPGQAAAGPFGAALFAFALRIPDAPDAVAPPAPRSAGLEPGLGRAALDRLPFPLLLIDPAGLIEYANPAARSLFERLRVGEHHSMSFRAPDFLDALAEAQAGGPPRSFDFTLHGDRNRVIRAHVDGASRPDEGARVRRRHVLCLFTERTQDLRIERMRTDFIANASHELRTPLASIRGFIETLQGPARDDPDAQERFLGIMQAQAGRMQRLVDDLLSLNRIELNEHVAPTERQDLGEIARETAEALGPVADERGVEIRLLAPAHGPYVRGDRDQLIQAIGNLLENGMKYGEGPVEIRPAAPSPSHPGMTGLTVRDHGEGIPREHLPRLTERFYRVSVRRSRNQGGTGLGLAIVKHIMSRHRGELTVESAPGEGASFTLWLPAEPGAADVPPRASADAPAG